MQNGLDVLEGSPALVEARVGFGESSECFHRNCARRLRKNPLGAKSVRNR